MSRFAQLRSYFERKYYSGYIRWILQNEDGTHVSCDQCGNIANGIVKVQKSLGSFYFPICKKHLRELYPGKAEYVPCIITVEPKRPLTQRQKQELAKQAALAKLTPEEKSLLGLAA
ncbi:hypothetical protein [Rufibacter latericius]|uniref:Uncharacterized protein n=1 Tax=Rufibacter latericius TaxID=2487040 RepID=A0A3M9MPK2_9BACT|nr:hypothetical protein [Rufibacter latericius]RNI26628.1 hypothetical protein EFB08_11460 [Rufibacter latericius]